MMRMCFWINNEQIPGPLSSLSTQATLYQKVNKKSQKKNNEVKTYL
jgi:hypothetical protein